MHCSLHRQVFCSYLLLLPSALTFCPYLLLLPSALIFYPCLLPDDIFRLAGWSSPAPGALGGSLIGGAGMNVNAGGGSDGASANSPSPFSWRKGPVLDPPALKDTGEPPFSCH